MSSRLLLCAALAVCAWPALSDETALEALRERALGENRAAQLVESLVAAAPYRFAGSAQDPKAVDWALKALREAGLSKVRAEPVIVPKWGRGCVSPAGPAAAGGGEASPATAGGPCKDVVATLLGEKPQEMVAVALGGSAPTPAGGLRAPVLMFDSLDALRAHPLEDIKGKIVFFNRRMERRADGAGYGAAVSVRVRGAAEAGRRGARAVLIRSIGTGTGRVAHTGAMRYDPLVPRIPAAALSAVDADLLEQVLRDQGRAEVQLDIRARDLGMARSANVIGEIPGESPEIVLLAAHLDSWDITPGANDDGAGVAIVIEAARAILQSGQRPRRTIRVLLAANEEFGLDGARAYARAHAAEPHLLGLEADFGSGAVHTLHAGVDAADWPKVEDMVRRLAPLGVAVGRNGDDGGADLGPMHARGMPVLGPRQDGTRYFDVHHSAADDVAALDREGLSQNVAVYALLAWLSAQGEAYVRLPVTAGN